ncbi:MAG: IclR family transcriptional regulator [Pseudomonadota bacterium]
MDVNGEVKSAARVLELLEFLARSVRPVTLKDVVNELGYPKSSAHGLLATLVSRGYALRDTAECYALTNAYRNGPGWLSGPDSALIDVAEPVMRDLRDCCGETIMLGVLNWEQRLKMVARCVANRELRYESPFSGGLPSYCTAMGRVLLAGLEAKQVNSYLARERLVKYTDRTIVNKTTLRQIIQETRRRGFAISDQELDMDTSGVAAPVRNANGNVVAALDVAAVSGRFAENSETYISEVVRYARQLGNLLGWRGS